MLNQDGLCSYISYCDTIDNPPPPSYLPTPPPDIWKIRNGDSPFQLQCYPVSFHPFPLCEPIYAPYAITGGWNLPPPYNTPPFMWAPVTLFDNFFPKSFQEASILIKMTRSRMLGTSLALKMEKMKKSPPQYRDETTK